MPPSNLPMVIWTEQGRLTCYACRHTVTFHDFRNRNALMAVFATKVIALHLSCIDHSYPPTALRADELLTTLGFQPRDPADPSQSSSLEPLETPVQPPDNTP